MASTTYTLGEIRDDIDADVDEVAATADEAAAEGDTDTESALEQYGETLVQRARAFDAAAEAYGADAELRIETVGVLDEQERTTLAQATTEQREERTGVEIDGLPDREFYYVAAGVTAAPWYDGDLSQTTDILDRAMAFRALPDEWSTQVLAHLKGLVAEVNALESGNVSSFAARREATTQTTEPS